ncbi:MAG: hypothetical protein DMG79_20910 [Acidobacteria bacterium]|nr:MAG: hypothetical protein DMG79_20910 [Acidobacteriota bacterium]
MQESSCHDSAYRSAGRRYAQLSGVYECRSRREAGRIAQLHQTGFELRAYLDSLGWAYFKLGKYEQAEENLTKAESHMSTDPTVQEHLGDLYQKTGRLKLAAAHWDRAVQEWNRTVQAEVDTDAFAKVQQKLDAAKVKLAKEESNRH